MKSAYAYHRRRQLLWGLVFIGIGAAVMLDRMYLLDIDELWHYWPLLLVVAGVNRTIGYPSARDFSKGLWLVFIGLWLFAVFDNAFGLTFRNSWPLVILAWGVRLLLHPLIARRFTSNQELHNEN